MIGKKESVRATFAGGDFSTGTSYRPSTYLQGNLSASGSTYTATFTLENGDTMVVNIARDLAIKLNYRKGMRGILTTKNGRFVSFEVDK